MSEREPELGLGLIKMIDPDSRRVHVTFPATGEDRLYALGTSVLKRIQFRPGETVTPRSGAPLAIESVSEEAGLLTYLGHGRSLREDEISDVTSVSLPQERLMAAQVDPGTVFDLRHRTLQARARFRQSDVRGFLGGRLELIPHQIYILHEVATRQNPRVLLADEVGLGKTIEAGLILQRLLAVGQASRVLILVPEPLVHQWFVELLRRFNLWFSIYDEARCEAVDHGDPAQNPFSSTQLALVSISLLAASQQRQEQAIGAGWDMVVVDEAHHLIWDPVSPSPEYVLVERLAQQTAGLLLLTATPTQLGLEGHFARLRLLDPNRYAAFDQFQLESERFAAVAGIAEKLIEQMALDEKDHATLQEIFTRDPGRLAQHLAALSAGRPGAREALLQALLDQHGTGRVVFRNTRAAMSGFPCREFVPAPLESSHNVGLLARIARELLAEESGEEVGIRYSFRDDPRITWLVDFLKRNRTAKALLICRSQRKVAAIEAALQEKMAVKSALFHEGMPLVQRDRNAAWFAEPDGARLLLCSEIGSEGRNFQFAHHLILFDLPLIPGLIEQRIGRLDRIGQTETIRIHVPYLAGSANEAVVEWYHRGLRAFEAPLHGGNEYQDAFRDRLLGLALDYGAGRAGRSELEAFIAETAVFREGLARKLRQGRDRLLELNSFNPAAADRVIAKIRAVDADPFTRRFLIELLDHFGVRVSEHEAGDVFLDPSHAFIEGFPSIPAEGMLATFSRARAIAREDIRFLSQDHALVQDAIDLLLESHAGTTAFATLPGDRPNLLLEAVFVLETVAASRWHLDRFLAPMPVRVVVDIAGNDRSLEWDASSLAAEAKDADIHRFLERPGFNASALAALLEAATHVAEKRSVGFKQAAESQAAAELGAELQRLVDLGNLNLSVRPEEIELARVQLEESRTAIQQARLRLDAMRLILVGASREE